MFHGINDIRVGGVPKPQAGSGEAVIWISYHLSTAPIFKLFAVLRDINSPDRHIYYTKVCKNLLVFEVNYFFVKSQ